MYVGVADVALPEAPFSEKDLGGVVYRVASDKLRSSFTMGLVGWKVRDTSFAAFGHTDAPVELEKTESARMTPYNESTGPVDTGDGYRWARDRRDAGRGIVILPPLSWQPSEDILRSTTGEITAVATENFAEVARHATVDKLGFVLVEPAQGWKNVEEVAVHPEDEQATKVLLVAAGLLLAVTVGLSWWEKRKR
jgi:hypothetical protein